jgi:hypothetical protein
VLPAPSVSKILGGAVHQLPPAPRENGVGTANTSTASCAYTGPAPDRAGGGTLVIVKLITGSDVVTGFDALQGHATGSAPSVPVSGVGAPALWVGGAQLVVLSGVVRIEVSALAATGTPSAGSTQIPEVPDQAVAKKVAKVVVDNLT